MIIYLPSLPFAGCQFLAERWLPRKDTWQIQLTEEVVPELLFGPDTADLLDDRPDDVDKPAIRISVPTDEDVAKYLPPQLPGSASGGVGMGPRQPAAPAAPPTVPPAVPGT